MESGLGRESPYVCLRRILRKDIVVCKKALTKEDSTRLGNAMSASFPGRDMREKRQ